MSEQLQNEVNLNKCMQSDEKISIKIFVPRAGHATTLPRQHVFRLIAYVQCCYTPFRQHCRDNMLSDLLHIYSMLLYSI